MSQAAQPAARLSGVRKAYGNQPVLTGLDLDVPAGKVTALLGPSGCGKTTMLRLVAGFDQVDGGIVELAGMVVDAPGRHVAARRRRLGYVPQDGALFSHLSVAQNIGFGVPRAQRAERTALLLELTGLGGLADRRPDQLSGGQQQRVALGRALAVEPALVLLDEPFTALDPELRAQVRQDVLALLRRAGAAGLLVTHDRDEALTSADQVAILLAGRVAQADPPRELWTRPASAAVARFLDAGSLLTATCLGPDRVRSPLGELVVAPHRLAPGQQGLLLVRREQVRLTDSADGYGPAEVVDRVFHGARSRLTLRLPGGQRLAAEPSGDPAALGSQVRVQLDGPLVLLA